MRVKVSLQTPVVNTRPRTVTARITLFTLFLGLASMRLGVAAVVIVLLCLCFGFADWRRIRTTS